MGIITRFGELAVFVRRPQRVEVEPAPPYRFVEQHLIQTAALEDLRNVCESLVADFDTDALERRRKTLRAR